MTPDSEAEKAAREYADNRYRPACSPNIDGRWSTHRDDFKAGFYTALARVQSAFRKIWEKEKAAHPDNIDGYGIVLAMNGAIEDLKAAKEVQDGE